MPLSAADHAAIAGQEAREKVDAWLLSLGRCSCHRPLRGRRYLGVWSCARCGKLWGRRAVRFTITRRR